MTEYLRFEPGYIVQSASRQLIPFQLRCFTNRSAARRKVAKTPTEHFIQNNTAKN